MRALFVQSIIEYPCRYFTCADIHACMQLVSAFEQTSVLVGESLLCIHHCLSPSRMTVQTKKWESFVDDKWVYDLEGDGDEW